MLKINKIIDHVYTKDMWIRGLCHSPQWLENPCGLWKKWNLCKEKILLNHLAKLIFVKVKKCMQVALWHKVHTWLYVKSISISTYQNQGLCCELLFSMTQFFIIYWIIYCSPNPCWWLASAWNPDCPFVFIMHSSTEILLWIGCLLWVKWSMI